MYKQHKCTLIITNPALATKFYVYTVISRLRAYERLKFTVQKTGVGVYTEKPFVHITHIHTDHKIIKNGGWALTRRWALTREIRYVCLQYYVLVTALELGKVRSCFACT